MIPGAHRLRRVTIVTFRVSITIRRIMAADIVRLLGRLRVRWAEVCELVDAAADESADCFDWRQFYVIIWA